MANITTLSNTSTIFDLPPLPSYTQTPVQPLIIIPDSYTIHILPVVAYWTLSLFFHYIDTRDIWPQYRLHTPAEILKRNHVSLYEVIRDVIFQHVVQTAVGALFGLLAPAEVTSEEYDIAVWARRLSIAQRSMPQLLLSLVGLDAVAISKNIACSYPMITDLLLASRKLQVFAGWEILGAKAMYWCIMPAFQYGVAILFVDTWQYFLHRYFHTNKWLYTHVHSRHHRLYVPYAFGALYNHPLEGFLLDTMGANIAFKLSGMSTRQGIWFFTFTTMKTVDDHCGYALPWDPLQHVTSNNAGYHDIHHQTWGIKTNFSQPFFTFWDRLLGTFWKGDLAARYEHLKKEEKASGSS